VNTVVNTKDSTTEHLGLQVSSDINQGLHLNDAFLIRFSTSPADNIIHDIVSIPTVPLEQPQLIEQWIGVNTCGTSQMSDWQFYSNDQYLIAAVPSSFLHDIEIDHATETAYTVIFEEMNRWNYPFLLRTWNYFPDITCGQDTLNNYHLFCSGRARAYEKVSFLPHTYPAATVIGTHQPGLFIYFIAGKSNGIEIENTQQVSAYHYPPAYSQDPPLFSRALLHRNRLQEILFVSGTASITGHSTQFGGDVNRQLDVCLNNIENLISTAIVEHQFAKITLQDCSHLKVYLKHAKDLDTVRTHLRLYFGSTVPVYYLQGDMCRPDLLVEIEAVVSNNLS